MTSTLVTIDLDGALFQCEAGSSVASVLLANNVYAFSSHPVDQSPRGAFCMMGACQACRVLVDGRWQQACQCVVADGMQVQLPQGLKRPRSSNVDAQMPPGKSDTLEYAARQNDAVQIDTDRPCNE